MTEAPAYRYERKFSVAGMPVAEVRRIVRAHPSLFFEEYAPRWVNNVYLDTPDLCSLRAHADGVQERRKVRVRWYGELLGPVASPVLEHKLKRGLVGRKLSRSVDPFELSDGLRALDLARGLGESLLPNLINRFRRQYYRSADRRFRVTIDSRMRFHEFSPGLRLRRWATPEDEVVVELKYGQQHDGRARPVASAFPFRVYKSSKYVTGMRLTDPRVCV